MASYLTGSETAFIFTRARSFDSSNIAAHVCRNGLLQLARHWFSGKDALYNSCGTIRLSATFLVSEGAPEWEYRHENLLNFHEWELNTYLDMQDPALRLKTLGQRLRVIIFWFFDLSMVALLWIIPILRPRSLRPILLLSALLLVAFMLTTWLNSNYISAAVPLYFIVLTECLRRLSRTVLPRTKLLVGPLLLLFLAIGTFVWAIQDVQPFDLNDSNYGYVRAQIIRDLQARGGRHLIFLHYSPQHPRAEEWIYNDADIPNSQIIWAHDMGSSANRELINRYPGREVWDFEADIKPQRLLLRTAPLSDASR